MNNNQKNIFSRKKTLSIILASVIVFATSLYTVAAVVSVGNSPSPQKANSSNKSAMPAKMPTKYEAVAKGKIDVDGGVINIAARRGGIYTEVFAEEGDIVEQGQLLAIQEDDEEKIAIKSAKLNVESSLANEMRILLLLEIAKRELARLAPIRDIDAASARDYDRANDEVKRLEIDVLSQKIAFGQAKASLESAEYRIEQRKVRAPLAGRIIEANARPGVGSSTTQVSTAFVLMPDAQRIVRADLDEAFVGKVVVGQKAIVSPDARPNETYEGTVIRVGEIFGKRSTQDNSHSGGSDHVIEVVIGMGDNPLLIGQRVLVRFAKLTPPSTSKMNTASKQGDSDAQ